MGEYLIAVALLAAGLLVTTASPQTETVWVASGQSNAGGKSPEQFAPPQTDRVQWYHPDKKQFAPIAGDLPGMTHRYSPFHTAGHTVAESGVTVKMLGYAKSGAPIRHWLENSANKSEPSGLDTLREIIADAGSKADVFIWDQGGADRAMDPQVYKRCVAELVHHVRVAADNEQMMVVVVQSGGRGGRWQPGAIHAIREAQRQFVVEDRNAVLVPAIGRDTVDGAHLTAESQADIGTEIGKAILRFQHHRADTKWPGPVLDACGLTPDGGGVIAHFAEVEQLSGVDPRDFKIIDREGENRCITAKAGRAVVTLGFARSIGPDAKLGYACDGDPVATLRDEAGYHAPAVIVGLEMSEAIIDEPTAAPNGAGLPK